MSIYCTSTSTDPQVLIILILTKFSKVQVKLRLVCIATRTLSPGNALVMLMSHVPVQVTGIYLIFEVEVL